MAKTQEISYVEWGLVIGVLFTVDAVQILLDLLLVGAAANRFIDIFVGLAFAFYLLMRGQIDMQRFFALLISFVGEEIPVVDALPFWGADGIYSMMKGKAKEKAEKAQEEAEAATIIASRNREIQDTQSARNNVVSTDSKNQKVSQTEAGQKRDGVRKAA